MFDTSRCRANSAANTWVVPAQHQNDGVRCGLRPEESRGGDRRKSTKFADRLGRRVVIEIPAKLFVNRSRTAVRRSMQTCFAALLFQSPCADVTARREKGREEKCVAGFKRNNVEYIP